MYKDILLKYVLFRYIRDLIIRDYYDLYIANNTYDE